MKPTIAHILGLDQSHLVQVPDCGSAVRYLSPSTLKAFVNLRDVCARQGIQLAIASSYRSFQQQLTIWNEKFVGKRPLLNGDGLALDMSNLDDPEKVFAILRWSALPGSSRHHWGSDLDVYDLAALPADYQMQLVPSEYQTEGPFERLGQFLDHVLADSDCCGFYRPYMGALSSVASEPWHLSYRTDAQQGMSILTKNSLLQLLAKSELAGKSVVLKHFDDIWQRFIAVD